MDNIWENYITIVEILLNLVDLSADILIKFLLLIMAILGYVIKAIVEEVNHIALALVAVKGHIMVLSQPILEQLLLKYFSLKKKIEFIFYFLFLFINNFIFY